MEKMEKGLPFPLKSPADLGKHPFVSLSQSSGWLPFEGLCSELLQRSFNSGVMQNDKNLEY
jgi:hypothetical protein